MPKLHGFEFVPLGQLLSQVVDLEGEMGIAFERSVGYYKDFHQHARDILVFPRGACRMTVALNNNGSSSKGAGKTRAIELSQSHGLFIPNGMSHDDRGKSTVYDTIALFPSKAVMEKLLIDNGLNRHDEFYLRSNAIKFDRSQWLNDLIERYFCARVLSQSTSQENLKFLEIQILNEMIRILFGNRLSNLNLSWADSKDKSFARILEYVESNLFEELKLSDICTHCATTESSLLRLFKRETGLTPGSYIQNRRLDEAARLLESSSTSISDVCLLVGYQDFSAFTRAFKRKFAETPSEYRKSKLSMKI